MDTFCLGPNSGIMKCRDCSNFSVVDNVREVGLDSVGMVFRSSINIIMCGRKIQSSRYVSSTKKTIDMWNRLPETMPDDVKISECNVCYFISFEIADVEDISSVVVNDMIIDKCYVIRGTKKFYPTIDISIKSV
jgi:hypothetical protein